MEKDFKVMQKEPDGIVFINSFETYQEAVEFMEEHNKHVETTGGYEDGICLFIDYQGTTDEELLDTMFKCKNCGEYLENENYYENNGEYFCEDCYYDMFTECEYCGDIVCIDDITEADGDYVCQNCLDEYFVICAGCNEYVHRDNYIYSELEGDCYCEGCFYDRFTYCEECDRECYADEVFCGVCNRCGGHDLLDNYHSMKSNGEYTMYSTQEEKDKNIDTDKLLYFGFELEVDDGAYMNEALESVDNILNSDKHLVNFEEDGSLSSDGFEIISQPMTLDFIRTQEEDIRKALQSLINNGYTSHNNGNCGLHIHFSRKHFVDNNGKYNENVDDHLVLLSETFKREFEIFCRRGSGGYVRFLSDAGWDVSSVKQIKGIDKKDDRYRVFNFLNEHTVEFRLVRGTLRFETFMASMEFLNNIIHFAKKTDAGLLGLTWNDIISYNKRKNKYLYQYCERLGLIDTPSVINFSKLDRQPTLKDISRLTKKNPKLSLDFTNNVDEPTLNRVEGER